MPSYSISCIGGTDSETDLLRIDPGAVVESMNYEVKPEGGYRRIDGYHLWSGASFFPDPADLQIVFTDYVFPGMLAFQTSGKISVGRPEGVGSVYYSLVGFREVFDSNSLVIGYYIAVQLSDPRRRLQVNDVLDGNLLNISIIREVDPDISDADYAALIANIFEQTNLAEKPIGQGPIRLIHNFGDSVYAVRDNGADAIMYQAISNSYVSGSWSAFRTFPGQAGQSNWRALNHHFTQRGDDSVYITNGNMDMQEVRIGQANIPIPATATAYPIEAIAHKNHLFLAHPKGQLYFSDSQDITKFLPVDGGGVINIGDEITGMQVLRNNELLITTNNTTKIIEGSGKDSWVIRDYTQEIGATDQTLQDLPSTIFCDRRGIYLLEQSNDSANFRSKTLSHRFDPIYREMRTERMMSTVNREKSQYRLFNPSGRALFLTFNDTSLAGAMAIDFGIAISCVSQSRGNEQRDEMFFGGEDGGVYRMDFGTSFNGSVIPSVLKLPYCHAGSPDIIKRWRFASVNMSGDPRTTLQCRAELEDGEQIYPDNRIVNSYITSGKQIFNGDFTWDLNPTVKARVDVEGSSTNVALVFKQDSATNYSHTIDTVTHHYTPRRPRR